MNGRDRLSWEETAINLAFDIAKYRSEDPFTQVGACALNKHGFSISLGYNGAPSGIDINWADRIEKNRRVIHAESNVLNYVTPGEIEILAVTHLPCAECLKIIKQKKIDKIIYSLELPNYDCDFVKALAKEYGITIIKIHPSTKNYDS
jgi:dCMP deaminase